MDHESLHANFHGPYIFFIKFQYFSWCLFHLDKKTYWEKYTGKCFAPLAQRLASAQNLIRSEDPVIQLLTTVALCGVRSFAEEEIFTVEEDKVRE